ncbi:MAG: peptidoglycan-binding protein [Clostridia bacterium]|nr:peptidoglycan-binding protein [Clostridia bacterium]
MRTDFPENDLRFDRALYVRELQTYLRVIAKADGRVPLIEADGVFGKETETAVKAAQNCAHLPETGRVDFATWNAVVRAAHVAAHAAETPLACAPFTRRTAPVCEGGCSPVVPFAKAMFNGLCGRFCNFETEPVTDEMTDVTRQNVRELQKICCRPQTGVLDETTWNELATTFNLCAVDRYRIKED